MTIPAPLILAIDIGSSSLRARLYDAEGVHVPGCEVQREYELERTQDGGATLDPALVAGLLDEALDALLAAPPPAPIAAVALDTLAMSLVGLDGAGLPVTRLYTYADIRPGAAAAQLRVELDERAVFGRTGCPLRAGYAAPLLRWLRESDPQRWKRACCWAALGDFIVLRMCGALATSPSLAAWSGLLDRGRGDWDTELLSAVGITPEMLPPIDEGLRMKLLPEHTRRWPALAEAVWLPAWGDGVASSAGSGAIGAGRAALSLGTSGAMRLLLDALPSALPWGLWAYSAGRGRTLLGGALNNGGSLFAWLSGLLREGEDLEAAVASIAPDGHGLTLLPFLAGERSPTWDADATGAIVGLRAATGAAELLRAGMESVAYRFGLLAQLLREANPQPFEVLGSGGALHASPLWCQIIADVLGAPLLLTADEEATSRGVALLALEALGLRPLGGQPAIARRFEPDPAAHVIYERASQRQLALERLLAEQL